MRSSPREVQLICSSCCNLFVYFSLESLNSEEQTTKQKIIIYCIIYIATKVMYIEIIQVIGLLSLELK